MLGRVFIHEGCRVLKNPSGLPAGILRDKTFRGGEETGSWKGDIRGVDEGECQEQGNCHQNCEVFIQNATWQLDVAL